MKDNLSHRSYFIPFITVSWAITVGSSRMWLGNSDWFWLSGCSWKIPIGQDHLEMICFSIAMLNYRGIPSPWKSHWNPMEISSKPHSTPIKIPSNPIKSHYIRIDITLTYYWTSIQSIFFLDGVCQKKHRLRTLASASEAEACCCRSALEMKSREYLDQMGPPMWAN